MELADLIEVARGDEAADLLLKDAKVVNVFTGEIEETHIAIVHSRIAGLGNYLRSEILWAASIAPGNKPSSLQRSDLQKLAKETLRISRRSYRNRGVTVVPSLAKSLKEKGMPYRKYRFYVFGRHGLPCYRCGTSIERQTMGSRNIFLCPGCQVA